ncbi:hypothetical protein PCANC_08634 [Puccinia coronata f. sp. avenae]|jgi:hypothetical protein|uniref:Uncharacterized protein n=1 Tax=Puccinia coronata f. sp. avenae TaxID=200324 RepID=A0A2N5UXP2_9BASI|nr:hypothetical protein PCANC_08634 [Puccinia coronata f. sp. avenae]
MVSTLLPFALLALAFSAWPFASGYIDYPRHVGHKIFEALSFANKDPNFMIEKDKAEVILASLADMFPNHPPIRRKEALDIGNLVRDVDDNGQQMFKPRVAQVINIMFKNFHQKELDTKVDIFKKLVWILPLPPPNAEEWAKGVLAQEENKATLVALEGGGLDYDTIVNKLDGMQLR